MKSKMDRKRFFKKIGIGVILTAVTASLPIKLFSSFAKTSSSKKMKVTIHPSAVKRNDKV